MRDFNPQLMLLCGLLLNVYAAMSQPAETSVSQDSPYGGVSLPVASITAAPTETPALAGAASVCNTNGILDPCVLTGQYNSNRTSTNVNESNLAGFNSTTASTFGLAQFYPLTHPLAGKTYEPVVAQPLYVTNVLQPDGTIKNLLIVASLGDWVYAFDTSTAALVWSVNLGPDCGSTGVPFVNNHGALPGAANLPYYGAVATPVIDITPAPPYVFVVSACTATFDSTVIQWNLDAIDIQGGKIRASQPIQDSGFNSSDQLARASLLLTHPPGGGTAVYVAFGAGLHEVAADCQNCQPTQTGSQYAYSGVLFGYSVTYNTTAPFVSFASLGSPFYTSCSTGAASCTTDYGAVFPPVYSKFDTNGFPLGPPLCTASSGCPMGESWAVNGGGIWMGSKGPSSTSTGNIYLAAGNGAFACSGTGSCTDPQQVDYWGMSAMKFPPANSINPTVPADFFAPYVQRYTTNMPNADANPAPYQTEELSRLDLDFGAAGVVLMNHTSPQNVTFAMTSDKSGYVYVMPAETQSMGLFQPNDAGLTNGLYTTQAPFQATRLPQPNKQSVCLSIQINSSGQPVLGGHECDELFELAWFNYTAKASPPQNSDLLIAWPVKESVEVFQGTLSNNNYSFGTTPVFDPCAINSRLCGGANPPFPHPAGGSSGAAMAVAANGVNAATLWAVVPTNNSASSRVWGALYAYTVNPDGSLNHVWDNRTATHKCSIPPAPTVTGWFVPSFTEPTAANGAVYVPSVCAVTDGKAYSGCNTVPAGSVQSGILVFTTCP
jgi:hypothetical protein